jgi:hypothetical protein
MKGRVGDCANHENNSNYTIINTTLITTISICHLNMFKADIRFGTLHLFYQLYYYVCSFAKIRRKLFDIAIKQAV